MRPSYFDPTPQPDTETQYRQGGKVNKMQKLSVAKKMPRKFQAGGKATAPALTGMDLERENARRDARVKKEKDAYEAQRPNSLGPRPAEKPEVKKAKGGSIRKFADGGETTAGDKDVSYEMPSEPATSRPRFSDDTYARARNFVGSDKKASASTYKASPKKVSTVKAEAKPAPAKSSDYGNESRRMTDNKPVENKKAPDSGTDVNSRLKKAFSNIDFGYLTRPNKALYKKGGAVKKYAKGGGIEVKGKTRGKVC
jgi:hypothetical protein